MTVLSQEILNQIERHLSGGQTDHDLEAWVVANLQRILDSGDSIAIDMANSVDSVFIELGEGIITRNKIRAFLESLVTNAKLQ